MVQLIDKSALVAKIESKIKYAQTLGDNAINSSMQQFYDGMKQDCVDILSSTDTLEVKEVNLSEHQIADIIQNLFPTDQFIESETLLLNREEALKFAKHFFELGLKAQKGK